MKEEITVNEHKSVGPYPNMYDHGPVLFIQDWKKGHDTEELWTCLDCGYTTNDNRAFLHVECERSCNHANQTMREFLAANDYPSGD